MQYHVEASLQSNVNTSCFAPLFNNVEKPPEEDILMFIVLQDLEACDILVIVI